MNDSQPHPSMMADGFRQLSFQQVVQRLQVTNSHNLLITSLFIS